jgi:nucleoid DNA-binding protein
MSLKKSDIVSNIALKTSLSKIESQQLLEYFIDVVKFNSKIKLVKVTNFGTFQSKGTPQRIGRNPITGKEHTIIKRKKLLFSSSSFIKKLIN